MVKEDTEDRLQFLVRDYKLLLAGELRDCFRDYSQVPLRTPYTLNPTSYTLHTTTCTLHPTPCTPHHTPCTPHPTPYTPHPTPYT